jgi:transposase
LKVLFAPGIKERRSEEKLYLRHTFVRKNGKVHTYWRLVRSVRVGSKVRQQTVAYLGELDREGRAKASALARHFLGERADQLDFFEDCRPLETARVQLDKVRVEGGHIFGDVWLAWKLWKALELDRFFLRVVDTGRESIAWADVAFILVAARLCEPSSELHIAEDWYRRTALEDLLGIDAASIHHTRLYEGLDNLLPHKVELEEHVKDRLGNLFDLQYDLLLYDVTSTYFEGLAEANTLARYGYSRDRRSDCKQVCIGLVVTREGFPLGYEVFAGNRTDVTTVEEIVEKMESRYGKARRIWALDRGMISKENLEWLKEEKRQYIVGTPRSELKHWEKELIEKGGWKEIREGLEVKLCPGPGGSETFILCRSADRSAKEKAMHERFSKRIVEGLSGLSQRLEKAKKKVDRSQVERQIGRLLGSNSRAAGKFSVEVREDESHLSGIRVSWKEDPQWSQWATLTEGAYVLRSNVTDWQPQDLWQAYMQLTEAENAFRIEKSQLCIRPVWHQKTDRVQAHILVCFLAYVLWKTLAGWQAKARLGSSPRTLLEELRRIESVDVVLPLEGGKDLRLRCVVQPDRAQRLLLERLGLKLPKRLRAPSQVAKM